MIFIYQPSKHITIVKDCSTVGKTAGNVGQRKARRVGPSVWGTIGQDLGIRSILCGPNHTMCPIV